MVRNLKSKMLFIKAVEVSFAELYYLSLTVSVSIKVIAAAAIFIKSRINIYQHFK